jgi:hypothetical protein
MEGRKLRTWPLPTVGGRVVAICAGEQGAVWIAEDHPDTVILWRQGTVERQLAVGGAVQSLAAPHFLSAPDAVMAVVATAAAFPQTGNELEEISAQGERTVAVNSAWLVPPSPEPYAGGISDIEWTRSRTVFATLWDAGLNQVALARIPVRNGGAATVLPNSNFVHGLLNGQPPAFPLLLTPSGVIIVGQGYGLAFYSPTPSAWKQFIK